MKLSADPALHPVERRLLLSAPLYEEAAWAIFYRDITAAPSDTEEIQE